MIVITQTKPVLESVGMTILKAWVKILDLWSYTFCKLAVVEIFQECIVVILLLTNNEYICIYIQELELAHQKDLPFEAGIEPEGGTNPTDEGYWKGISGGYDCKFMDSPLSVLQTDCPICRLILRDPYQATCCGTSFCHTCSQRIKAGNNHCPTCRRNNFEVFPNKGLKRSICQLTVFCTHRKDGCTWKGELGELEHHLDKVIHTSKSFHYGCDRAQWKAFHPSGKGL